MLHWTCPQSSRCNAAFSGDTFEVSFAKLARIRRSSYRQHAFELCGKTAIARAKVVTRAFDPEILTDPDVPLSKLKAMLNTAIEEEDYDLAAQLRDTLQRRQFDNRLAVEEANERFYQAFQSGSMRDMASVWGKGEHVQCIHPMAGCIAGRNEVLEGWKAILGGGRMKIRIDDVRTFTTDSIAYVTCVEMLDAGDSKGRVAATNIFEKQGGEWKLVHHQGGQVARLG